jgi:hypothetical protein
MDVIKEEEATLLKAEESRIRTTLLADHKEAEVHLAEELSEHHRRTMEELQYELEIHSNNQLKKARRTVSTKAKESVHRVYGSTVVFNFYSSFLLQTCFIAMVTYSILSKKNRNNSFF